MPSVQRFRATSLRGLAMAVAPAVVLLAAFAIARANGGGGPVVFVNEIHYDNAGADVGEFIEIAGPAGTNLGGWTIALYNGNASQRNVYDTILLTGTIPDQQNGFGTLTFLRAGIQNGNSTGTEPDGLALVDASSSVVQFLSYEGTFIATSGPAAGMTSTDIGVSESVSEPIGMSLQLQGTGTTYGDFSWAGPTDQTPGAVNVSQTFGAGPPPPPPPPPPPGALVISQVYGGGGNAGATLTNDFIELFNRSESTVGVTGWSVQYTSASGTEWQTTALNGSIPPGGYYLVQEAMGAAGTVGLPVPDAVGAINMSASAGKVALVDSTTPLAGSGCPLAASVVDFVGYGSTANCFEGPAPTAAPSNTTAVLRAFLGCTDSGNNLADFVTGAPRPRDSASPTQSCVPLDVAIHEIQGSGDTSPYEGELVGARGIVTGRKSNGFYLQTPDAGVDADLTTSEGIFVFTSSAPPEAATAGNEVRVVGFVQEFVPSQDPGSPPITEITGPPIVSLVSTGNPLPAPITITAADTDPAGSIEQLERLEAMRVHVASLTAVSPTQGSISEVNATSTTNGVFYGVITGVARPFREPGIEVPDALPPGAPCCVPRFDANPERLRVDSDGLGAPALEVTTGAVVTGLTGPLDYAFRTYTILPDPPPAAPPSVSGNVSAVPVRAPAPDEFTVGSFNLERLFDTVNDPAIGEPVLTTAAFDNRLRKASLAVRGLMHSPDIVGVQEVENLGTLQALAARINADAVAAGQPDPGYQAYLEEGNDIGGIDVGFLVKGAPRVTVLDVTQPGKTATFRNPNTGTLEILNDRPPLVLRATVQPPAGPPFQVTVVVNHLRSLNGIDDPADGNRVRTKRLLQAQFLASLIQTRQLADPRERIVSVGDYNAFQFSDGYVDSIGTIKGTPAPADEVVLASGDLVDPDLTNLVDLAPPEHRYSFSFDGNAQVLDHVLVTPNVLPSFRGFDYARNGADFPESFRNDPARPERLSDHDMPVAYLRFPNNVPVANAGGPYSVSEAGSVVLNGSGFDPDGDPLTFAWDLDDNGSFGTAGQNPVFSAADRDGPASQTVVLRVCDDEAACALSSSTVAIANVAPTIVSLDSNPLPVDEASATLLSLAFTDPGSGDTHTAAWDFGDGTSLTDVIDALGRGSLVQHTYGDNGIYRARVIVSDDDGGQAWGEIAVEVLNVAPAFVLAPQDQTIAERRTLAFEITGHDLALADVLTLTPDGLPPGASYTSEAAAGDVRGVFTWTPTCNQSGQYPLTFTLRDDDGGDIAASMMVTVSEACRGVVAVTNRNGSFEGVTFVDPDRNTAAVAVDVAHQPLGGVAFYDASFDADLDAAKLYVNQQGPGSVNVLAGPPGASGDAVFAFVPILNVRVGNKPAGVAVTPDGAEVWTADWAGDSMSILDRATDTVIATIPMKKAGRKPEGIAFGQDSRYAYVPARDSNNVLVVNRALAVRSPARAIVGSVATGRKPIAAAVDPAGGLLYVATADGVDVLSLASPASPVLVARVASHSPGGLATAAGKLYVTNTDRDTVSVFVVGGTAPFLTAVAIVPVGRKPYGIAAAPADPGVWESRVYVANRSSDSLTVIDAVTDSVIATVSVGRHPGAVAVGILPSR